MNSNISVGGEVATHTNTQTPPQHVPSTTITTNTANISAPVVDLTRNNNAMNHSNKRKREESDVIALEDGEVVDLT